MFHEKSATDILRRSGAKLIRVLAKNEPEKVVLNSSQPRERVCGKTEKHE
jgi:hypothetical protein